MIDASVELGERLAIQAVEALKPFKAQSYGKSGIVGLASEQVGYWPAMPVIGFLRSTSLVAW